MKKVYPHRLFAVICGLSLCISAGAQVSLTAYNTGEQAGTWSGARWNYVSGYANWVEQFASADRVSCRTVMDCSLAIGTRAGGKFYPHSGFIRINNGSTWAEVYSMWRTYHSTETTFTYPEVVERLSASDACVLVGLYWGNDEKGGYKNWQPVPESYCAPISGP